MFFYTQKKPIKFWTIKMKFHIRFSFKAIFLEFKEQIYVNKNTFESAS